MSSSSDQRRSVSNSSASSEVPTGRYISAFERKQRSESSQEIDLPAPVAHLKAIPGSVQEDPQKRILKAVKNLSSKAQSFSSDSDTELPGVSQPKAKISLLPSKSPSNTTSKSSNSSASASLTAASPASSEASSSMAEPASARPSLDPDDLKDRDSIAPEPHFPVVTLSAEQRAMGIHTLSSSINESGVVYSHTLLTAGPSSSKTMPKVGGRHTLIHSVERKSASNERPISREKTTKGKVLRIAPKQVDNDEQSGPQVDYVTAGITLVSIFLTFLIMTTLALAFLWPEHLPRLNLTVDRVYLILLIEIAIILLMSSCQGSFSMRFRRAIFAGGLITVAETLMVLYFS